MESPDMEDVSVSDSTKNDAPSKKRRVLKRVMKKDKAKGFKPKRNLNTSLSSLSSLSKSLNRSVTSRFVKQTLQANNRQLAMALEKNRKDLRMASNVIMDQKREIIDLQTQVSTYKHLAGLKPEEIENEVKFRMEKYISELKTQLGKMGQQLFDATASLGEAMDLCMNVSRRSTGSCRSSSMCVMSDDDWDSHHGQAVRAPMFQSEVLMSNSPTRSLPQRVARLDMSVITEQSILIDDIPQSEDMMEIPVGEELQEEVLEEENQNTIERIEDKKLIGKTRSKGRSRKDEHSKGGNQTQCTDVEEKELNSIRHEDEQMTIETTESQIQDKKLESENKTKKKRKRNQSGNSANSSDRSDKVKDEEIKLVSKKTEMMNTEKNEIEQSKKDRRGTFVLSGTNPTEQVGANKIDRSSEEVNIDSQDTGNHTRSKNRRETFVLSEKAKTEDGEQMRLDKDRRGTFVVPSESLQNFPQSKDRRETFVLSENIQSVVTSKSQENISSKKKNLSPKSSKSDSCVNSKEDKRKTFLVPSSEDSFLLPPPPPALKKASPQKFGESDVTEYFNSDMEFTEVIDNSKGIIMETSDTKANDQSNVKSSKDSDKKDKSSAQNDKKIKNDVSKKVKSQVVASDIVKDKSKTEDKRPEENQSAVEFRLPKPGKIVFAASRKMLDGTRERVPTKLPQRSRSKTKIKLTKSKTDDSNVNSIFDFHEKTPTVLKHASSVYDMSMDVSVHGEKESYSTFRDKLNSQTNNTESQTKDQKIQSDQMNDQKLQSVQTNNQKLQSDQNKESAREKKIKDRKPNQEGEIIYHLPLKGCSPDIPKKTSRSRSKSKGRDQQRERSESRGRSRSRGKRMVVVDQDVDEGRSVTRSRSWESKSWEKSASTNGDVDVEISEITKSSRSRSRPRKNIEENGIKDDQPAESRSQSRGRSRARKNNEKNDKIVENINQATTRSKSRGRSRSRKTENETEPCNNDLITDSESQPKEDLKSRSRSRGRSRTRKDEELKDDDPVEPEFVPIKRITRSKSRGRSRSKAMSEIIGDWQSDHEENMSQESVKQANNTDVPESLVIQANSDEDEKKKTQSSRSNTQKSRSCVAELYEKEKTDDAKLKSELQTGRSKSYIAPRIDLSDDDNDDDFQPKKSTKKSRTKSKSKDDEGVHPLDKLFKNARKKSFPDLGFSCETTDSVEHVETDNVFSGRKEKSFHEICETPMKPRDDVIRHSGENVSNEEEILIDESPVKNNLCSTDPLHIQGDLQCVTKRSRSRSKKLDRNQDLGKTEDDSVPESSHDQVTDTEKQLSSNTSDISNEMKKEQNLSDSAIKEGKGKRRHDSSSEPTTEKKKKSKKEDKENKKTGTSSLSSLKKRLASLGPKLKPENIESPIKEDQINKVVSKNVQSPMVSSKKLKEIQSPALVSKKSDENLSPNVLSNQSEELQISSSPQGAGVVTPDTDNVLEAPRSRRRAANVCYKEMPLHAKLRREDVLSGKKLIG